MVSDYSFQNELVGLGSIFFAFFICSVFSIGLFEKAKIYWISFTIKITLLIIVTWFWIYTTDDYEGVAETYRKSAGFFGGLLSEDEIYGGSYLVVCVFIYELFGRQPILLEISNLIASMFVLRLLLVYYNKEILLSRVVLWLVCLLPTYQLHSVIILKESFICFFLVLGTYFYLKAQDNLLGRFVSIFFSSIVGLLHTPLFIFPAVLIALEIFSFGKKRSRNFAIFLLFVFGSCAFLIISLQRDFVLALFEREDLVFNELSSARASYIDFISVGGGGIVRFLLSLVCFFFAPLIPFRVDSISDIYALTFNFVFLALFFFAGFYSWRNGNWNLLKIMIATIACLAIYAIGTVNYGTAIRHREKVLPLLVLVVFMAAEQRRQILIESPSK